MAIPQHLVEASLRNQVLLERLKAGDVRKYDTFLRKIDAALRDYLTRDDITAYSRTRAEALLRDVSAALAGIYGQYQQQLLLDLRQVAEYEGQFEARSLTQTVEGHEITPPTVERLIAAVNARPLSMRAGIGAGQLLEPFVSKWTKSQIDSFIGTIRRGYFEGRTNQQILQAIRGTKALRYSDGLMAISKRQGEALVRTAVQHVASSARSAVWKANSDLVQGYQWIATLDARTCAQCRSLDLQVFKVNAGPLPPIHIGCRCATVAELDPKFQFLREGATRASMHGQVPATENYYDWLKQQPSEFQDAVLGPKRGQLLRDGGLSARRFSALQLDRQFQPLTLDEMKKLEPLAFKRAGLD